MTETWANSLIEKHKLPQTFSTTIEDIYRPLAAHLNSIFPKADTPSIIGINGCQGSGKSTMAEFMRGMLKHEFDREGLILSLDDFYLSKSRRVELSETCHSLLKTRGVPGTHNIDLLLETIAKLQSPHAMENIFIPQFDKGIDDLKPQSEWEAVTGKPDFILLEGWCISATPQSKEQLNRTVNELERKLDPGGTWRQFVNDQLQGQYADLNSLVDHLVVIHPPSTDVVFQWRQQQERKLRAQDETIGQTDEQLKFFIMHYERLTKHMHETLPKAADTVVGMNADRSVSDLRFKN